MCSTLMDDSGHSFEIAYVAMPLPVSHMQDLFVRRKVTGSQVRLRLNIATDN